jgi:hypothetical protein
MEVEMAYDIWQSCALVPGFSRAECASWVQAWGSIGAILGAAAVAGWQARNSRRDQERARDSDAKAKAAAIKGILRRANIVINNADRNVAGDPQTVMLAIEQVDQVQATLRTLPIFEIPNADLVFLVQRLDRDLHYVTELLRRFSARPATDARVKKANNLIERIRGRTRQAHAACDSMLAGKNILASSELD